SDKAFKTADDLYLAQGSSEGRAQVHYQRGVIYLNEKNTAIARQELQLASTLAFAAGNEPLQILSQLQLSSVTFTDGDPRDAQRIAMSALDVAKQKGMEAIRMRGLVDLGNAFLLRGAPDEIAKAEECYREALNSAVISKDSRNEARARFSLGNL